MLRSSQTGAFCLKHKKINEEIFLTYAIASKITINTISMTNIIENILNAFFLSLSPPFYFFSSTINCSGSAPTYVPPTTAGLSPRRRLLPLYGSLYYAIINIYPYNNHKKYNSHNCNPYTANYLSLYYPITTFYPSYPKNRTFYLLSQI